MMQPFHFPTNQAFIIAEAGVNHNGDMALARQLIDGAKVAGADAVKFQLFDPETLTAQDAPMAQYQVENGVKADSQQEMLKQLALQPSQFTELQAYAHQVGILFLCSPFDEASAEYLHHHLHLPCLKIASGELTNLPFLRMLARLNTPLILSTGMATLTEVQTAIETVQAIYREQGKHSQLAILQCVSAYPAPAETINLKAMQTLQAAFPEVIVGYSDHTLGIHISLAAVAMGAKIIEKHFTLDTDLPGPDHKASLTVPQLTEMVTCIREIEAAQGSGKKEPHPIELDTRTVARKSLVYKSSFPIGHVLSATDLACKRPGSGISPAELDRVIGKKTLQAVSADTLIEWPHLG